VINQSIKILISKSTLTRQARDRLVQARDRLVDRQVVLLVVHLQQRSLVGT
jgi:hypothetical protein